MALLGRSAEGAVGADGVDMVVDSSCLFGRSVRWRRAMSKGLMSLQSTAAWITPSSHWKN